MASNEGLGGDGSMASITYGDGLCKIEVYLLPKASDKKCPWSHAGEMNK